MKNKKSLFAIIAVLLVAVIGATLAYFQSSASFENVFNTGTYKVVTTEVFESPTNWKPGEEIPKTITSTNEGTIPAAVRVSYTEQWLDENNNDITSQVANGTVIINLDNTSDWTNEGNYYYYNYILEPQQSTTSFIKSVTLNPNLNGITCTPSNDGSTQTCTSNNPILGGTYKLIITKETVQADRYQDVWNTNISITEKPKTSITYLSRQVEGQITPGDIIGIGETEDFYVLSSDSEKTILLSKYNLFVEYEIDDTGIVTETYDESYPGYGLQSVNALGYNGYEYGTSTMTQFCYYNNASYWMDSNDNLLSKYTNNDTIYFDRYKFKNRIDDSDAYPYIYDENSAIYVYINKYLNRLIEMGAPSNITGRLLSYEEAYANKDLEVNNNSIIFNGQDYWLGTASGTDDDEIWIVDSTGNFNDIPTNDRGLRPVIEIPTSEIN